MTDWVHKGSFENSNQSQLNVVDADPSACVSVHPTLMSTSFLGNPEGVNIIIANSGELTPDSTPLLQQQSCAAGKSLNDTAFAPPPFEIAHLNTRKFVENCVTNPIQAVLLQVLPSLEPVMTVNCNATAIDHSDYHQQLLCNSDFSKLVFLHESVATSPRTAESNFSCIYNPGCRMWLAAMLRKQINLWYPLRAKAPFFYCNLSAQTAQTALHSTRTITNSLQQNPLSINAPPFVPTMGLAAPVAPAGLTIQDLAQLLAASKKDQLPEWKLFPYNDDPLQWHEWFIQFKSAIDSASLSYDVKLTNWKTLVTGKAKTAIAKFAYCGTM